jgi:hypothetical protein
MPARSTTPDNISVRIGQILSRPLAHKVLRGLLLIVAVVLLVQTYRKAMRPDGYDFTSYLQSAEALTSGADPYHTPTPFPYIYPLFLAFVLIPLTHVPYSVAVFAWFMLGAASLYWATRIAAREADPSGRSALVTGASLFVLLGALDPIQIDLLNGQVNTEVLLLCLLFFVLYEKKRRAVAAACLATAIALKIVPLVLLLFLALRREWQILAGSLAVAAVLCLSPIVLVGGRIWPLYEGYVREFLLGRALPTSGEGVIDFTPYGFIGRLLPAVADSSLVRFGTVALVLGVIASFQLRHRDPRLDFRFLALYLVAIPLLSPMSEVHHLIFVLPAAFLLSAEALDPDVRPHATVIVTVAVFWGGLWVGRLDRPGPYYFVALAALVVGLLRWTNPLGQETRERLPRGPLPPPPPPPSTPAPLRRISPSPKFQVVDRREPNGGGP